MVLKAPANPSFIIIQWQSPVLPSELQLGWQAWLLIKPAILLVKLSIFAQVDTDTDLFIFFLLHSKIQVQLLYILWYYYIANSHLGKKPEIQFIKFLPFLVTSGILSFWSESEMSFNLIFGSKVLLKLLIVPQVYTMHSLHAKKSLLHRAYKLKSNHVHRTCYWDTIYMDGKVGLLSKMGSFPKKIMTSGGSPRYFTQYFTGLFLVGTIRIPRKRGQIASLSLQRETGRVQIQLLVLYSCLKRKLQNLKIKKKKGKKARRWNMLPISLLWHDANAQVKEENVLTLKWNQSQACYRKPIIFLKAKSKQIQKQDKPLSYQMAFCHCSVQPLQINY